MTVVEKHIKPLVAELYRATPERLLELALTDLKAVFSEAIGIDMSALNAADKTPAV